MKVLSKTTVRPTQQKKPPRDKIIHDFARWTVLSALRSKSPVKSRKEVYPLLKDPKLRLDELFDEQRGLILTKEFTRWHSNATAYLAKPPICHGWAAKIINVYLKTSVYVGGLGRPGLAALIHPPIDGGLWAGLQQRFKGDSKLLKLTNSRTKIKDITSYEQYLTIIRGCRMAAAKEPACLLIEVDQWWTGADAVAESSSSALSS